ncbi:protein of unknown function [Candidatus Nitrosotalea okcheonensis]|uniref:Uncharacterized protein n=1 Tax=Candidatus Nitrosotalea okcheonensis TaxID=1903276 RepID=A0A2H1FER0_9ARCH|nr:protein of unknown function [Candidatus Nitrosotalea okcheonensis]
MNHVSIEAFQDSALFYEISFRIFCTKLDLQKIPVLVIILGQSLQKINLIEQ